MGSVTARGPLREGNPPGDALTPRWCGFWFLSEGKAESSQLLWALPGPLDASKYRIWITHGNVRALQKGTMFQSLSRSFLSKLHRETVEY